MAGDTLRVHFTPEDILRTRLLGVPDPMWELVLSVHQLREHPRSPAHARWRAAADAGLGARHTREAVRVLSGLIPARGSFPDFLTPYPEGEPFESALATIAATTHGRLAADLRPERLGREPCPFEAAVAAGDPATRARLTAALRRYHDELVRPHWKLVCAAVERDAALRGRHQLHGGMQAMLAGLGPGFRWRWPVLETPYPRERDLYLRGRGLLLVSSFFCHGGPVTMLDEERGPVLVFPAAPPGGTPPVDLASLGGVLGPTRARILSTLQRPHSTSSLAGAIDMSAASASQQVTLLRKAGLVRSSRRGQAMLHTITGRGRALLD